MTSYEMHSLLNLCFQCGERVGLVVFVPQEEISYDENGFALPTECKKGHYHIGCVCGLMRKYFDTPENVISQWNEESENG